MAKFFGRVGYNVTEEVRPGVFKQHIVEKEHMGDIIDMSYRNTPQPDSTVDDISISNTISFLADPFAIENISNMVYVNYLGAKWKITLVSFAYPRVKLTLGGLYNGPEAENGCASSRV